MGYDARSEIQIYIGFCFFMGLRNYKMSQAPQTTDSAPVRYKFKVLYYLYTLQVYVCAGLKHAWCLFKSLRNKTFARNHRESDGFFQIKTNVIEFQMFLYIYLFVKGCPIFNWNNSVFPMTF